MELQLAALRIGARWGLMSGISSFLILAEGCAVARTADAGLSFYETRHLHDSERVIYRFKAGGRWREATPRPSNAARPLYDYRIKPRGSVQVQVELVRKGVRISEVSLVIPSGHDRRFEVFSEIGPNDPTRTCFGCLGVLSAPIAGEEAPDARRLWVYYSFNGISHRIIF